jgi:hypothetical protein
MDVIENPAGGMEEPPPPPPPQEAMRIRAHNRADNSLILIFKSPLSISIRGKLLHMKI